MSEVLRSFAGVCKSVSLSSQMNGQAECHLINHYAEYRHAKCHNHAESHYNDCYDAKYHYAEYHYAEDHYAEDHYAEDHYAEHHYAGYHYVEFLCVKCHHTDCCYAEFPQAECQ
jgi:hypothetical protein